MKGFNLLEQYCENEKLLKINMYPVVNSLGEGGTVLKIEQREYHL